MSRLPQNLTNSLCLTGNPSPALIVVKWLSIDMKMALRNIHFGSTTYSKNVRSKVYPFFFFCFPKNRAIKSEFLNNSVKTSVWYFVYNDFFHGMFSHDRAHHSSSTCMFTLFIRTRVLTVADMVASTENNLSSKRSSCCKEEKKNSCRYIRKWSCVMFEHIRP